MNTPIPALLDPALGLTLAVVASSTTPLLLLDGDLAVLAASQSFFSDFQVDPNGAVGQRLFALGSGVWNVPQLRSLLEATASGAIEVDSYEMDLADAGEEARRLVINARNLSYGDAGNVRLLVTITDVTAAQRIRRAKDSLLKEKDDLLAEKVLLLQELQHRVANSLQIIASLILQSARKVQSDETRGVLTDAHSRVMSVAALQRQLATSQLTDVALADYFKQLCASIGASMIRDPSKLLMVVDVDGSVRSPHDSISLGLIVTELAINALKHAFVAGGEGCITVSYRGDEADWTLSVADDGVGMPAPENAKAGLGSSIVQALAQQLEATVEVESSPAGVTVRVLHRQAGLAEPPANGPAAA